MENKKNYEVTYTDVTVVSIDSAVAECEDINLMNVLKGAVESSIGHKIKRVNIVRDLDSDAFVEEKIDG